MFRIIAKLDAKPPHIVKPVYFEGLRKIGSPGDVAERYLAMGADEVVYLDIVASLYRRPLIISEVENIARRLDVPFGVGGGVRSIEDFNRLFLSGADKVLINSYPLQEDSRIISIASELFGSQSVVIHIDAKRHGKDWVCQSDCGRMKSSRNVLDWALEVEQKGAGEIILQSIDQDGSMSGFDIDLIERVVNSVSIPVVAASGAGSVRDILDMVDRVVPSGVAISSALHYDKFSIRQLRESLNMHGLT